MPVYCGPRTLNVISLSEKKVNSSYYYLFSYFRGGAGSSGTCVAEVSEGTGQQMADITKLQKE